MIQSSFFPIIKISTISDIMTPEMYKHSIFLISILGKIEDVGLVGVAWDVSDTFKNEIIGKTY